jgi:hypothetical protein
MKRQKRPQFKRKSASSKPSNGSGLETVGKSDEDISLEDQETIVEDVGTIPDRDQMFGVDHKSIPSGEVQDIRSQWPGDREDDIKGDRTANSYEEEMDDKADTLHGVTEENSISDSLVRLRSTQPFLAKPTGEPVNYESLSDADLQNHADVLGIPGRDSLSRMQLVQAIKNLEQAS